MTKRIPWTAGEPAGDRFRQSVADNYLSDRVDKPVWAAEHSAVEMYLGRVRDGARVFDCPFGTGRFAPLFFARGMRVTGVDISPDMLRVARQELGEIARYFDIREGDALRSGFPDSYFDVIVSIRFLESIIPMREVEPTLREFRRLCDGIAIVRLNNRLEDQPPKMPPSDDDRMGSAFYLSEVGDLVARCGWDLTDSVVVQKDADGKGEKRVCLLSAR